MEQSSRKASATRSISLKPRSRNVIGGKLSILQNFSANLRQTSDGIQHSFATYKFKNYETPSDLSLLITQNWFLMTTLRVFQLAAIPSEKASTLTSASP